ncbi:MAG: acyl-CoA dehydrogenase family protein [Deltaproteobacteria bacterium]|nr:acyl-CoA dehydrogenase family protein [Deltaproteobacteria bacterium]
MIDFRPTATDEAMLARLHAEALICRRHARAFDEREAEMIPDVLPEAAAFEAEAKANPLPKPGPDDTPPAVMMMLQTMAAYWGDYSVRLRRSTSGGLGNAALMAAGTEAQKAKWGQLLLSMAITEPGCGSDPSRVSTTAVLDEQTNEWILNGEKIFVTTGIRADGVVLWATLDKSAGRAGIKSFLVVKGTPGFDVPHKEKKLGIRADDTAAYVFRDCRIPRENLLGGDESIPKQSSGGFRGVMKTFNMTRPLTAAMGLGIAEAALDATREALTEAGVELDWATGPGGMGRLSAAAERFMRLETLFEASKWTVLQCAWMAGKGLPNNLESSVSKAHAGSAVRQITQGCIEILGAMGISREHLFEKWMRDSRITDIYEGTGEIQRLIIARGLLDYTRDDLK